MNKKQKVKKTILSILSGIFAVLTLFFFVQIIVKANTPLLTTISDNAEESDDTEDYDDNYDTDINDDYNSYDEEDEDIDDWDDNSDDWDDDSDYEPETEADEEGRIHREQVFGAYYRYLQDWYDYFTYDGADAEVAFYDINYDGTDEMIVSFGTNLADWTNEIYSITDYIDYNVQQLDTVGSHQSFYEADDGDGLYLVRGIQGTEIITQLTMNYEGDEVYLDEISNRHIDADEDYYSNDYPLEFQDLDSYLGY